MYALVDGNNFYVSCERVFRPDLKHRPVIVLSNNDGCAIARSNEAKEIGVAMGAPWFKIRHLEQEAGLVALSANFELYGDMSDRMMRVAAALGHSQEIYSIDESFIDLSGVKGDLIKRGHTIRSRILRCVGIPCGIGMGETKTLAKLANYIAKTAERKPGSYPDHLAQVCNLAALEAPERDAVLQATGVREVWGVGPRISKQLIDGGISTVLDLVRLDPTTARRGWSVVLERTIRELQGTPCIGLDDVPEPKKEIACTRSFGHPVSALTPLSEAVSEFASRAAVKLRTQGSLAGQIKVFIHTSQFRDIPQYAKVAIVPLVRPTADTAAIVKAALIGLKTIYKPGFQLSKAGVILMDFQSNTIHQQELDFGAPEQEKRAGLMAAIDTLNDRFGRGAIFLASSGNTGDKRAWSMKQERRTPAYTTRLSDLPVVRA